MKTTKRNPTDKPFFGSEPFSFLEARALRPFWTVEQLAEFLRIPKSWIYERTRGTGPEVIPHLKTGTGAYRAQLGGWAKQPLHTVELELLTGWALELPSGGLDRCQVGYKKERSSICLSSFIC